MCVYVCVCGGGFNVWVCARVGFVMCGCLYLWVLKCVDVLTIESVCWLYVFLNLMCFCIVYFMYINSFLLLR